ncbi:arsenate reductase ArsC [Myxococcota bacterium]|nr:arsenate reductase ArsC [Myxococcota bacterium]MBU1534919.1 arsenate reductase ArsC [Myxococcota bacterium]
MDTRLRVLFLCTGNSCRSQMAEGFANAQWGELLEAFSAGVETHGLNPHAVGVMAEVGVDISSHRSTLMDEFLHLRFDAVITVCDSAREACPFFPGAKTVIHQSFPDPPLLAREVAERGGSEDEQRDCYREVRDMIAAYVTTLPVILREVCVDHKDA